jgi:hypothetical protein
MGRHIRQERHNLIVWCFLLAVFVFTVIYHIAEVKVSYRSDATNRKYIELSNERHLDYLLGPFFGGDMPIQSVSAPVRPPAPLNRTLDHSKMGSNGSNAFYGLVY